MSSWQRLLFLFILGLSLTLEVKTWMVDMEELLVDYPGELLRKWLSDFPVTSLFGYRQVVALGRSRVDGCGCQVKSRSIKQLWYLKRLEYGAVLIGMSCLLLIQ
jgi:hypothetical protein